MSHANKKYAENYEGSQSKIASNVLLLLYIKGVQMTP